MREFAANRAGRERSEATPLDAAQDLVYDAIEESNPARRLKLIERALTLSPDVADAYVLLAEDSTTAKAALPLYEQGVAAGERALGPTAFRDHVGHFWGIMETRPYMRAREGLAVCLWSLGRQEEAVAHLQDMLRLNPNDNQGVRYNLAAWLLLLDRREELVHLLDRYDENSAAWAYTWALVSFRIHRGDVLESRKKLKAAQKVNPFVPAYLLQTEPIPDEDPPHYSRGSRDEAILYVRQGLSAWRSTPGALTWVKEVLAEKSSGKQDSDPSPEGPTEASRARLMRLRQEHDTWQVDARLMQSLILKEGQLVQPWVILIISMTRRTIVGLATETVSPTPERIWDVLARGMTHPKNGKPHRPDRLEILPKPVWDVLCPHLGELSIDCYEGDCLDAIDFYADDLSRTLRREEPPGLMDTPGVTPDLVAGFYRAAAEFYRRAPWRFLGFEEAIQIDCDRFKGGPWYAIVMGRLGLVQGLTLYTDLKMLLRMLSGMMSDEQAGRLTVALTVHFGPSTELSTLEILAGREHGWEVADMEAYPSVFKKEKGMEIRPPVPWEIELMEACLRAVPDFIATHRQGDTTPDRRTVPAGDGEATLTLRWLDED